MTALGAALNFGSLNPALAAADPHDNLMRSLAQDGEFREQFPETVKELRAERPSGAINYMRSAGPVSDSYILNDSPVALIIGPGGSGKTVASIKKALVEAQRIRPGADGVRRYVLGVWRQKYDNLWKATIPSWWRILPRDLPGSQWTGSSPRTAEHVVNFEDGFGPIQLIARFRAFGESANPDDMLGNEFTDCYLNEWPTTVEELFSALVDRVGRDPPREITRRSGRFFGDGNAPDVLHYTYRDFYEKQREGFRLFLQPSGLAPEAENLQAVGREYYQNSAMLNAHRPWWIKRMIHAQPGFTRASDPVYPKWDDARNLSPLPLRFYPELPVIAGVDGGLTPAAVYMQETAGGQVRILAEVALERGGMKELSVAMLATEARLFPDATFITRCDPAMGAGEDVEGSSDRKRLETFLGRKVKLARTNNFDERAGALLAKFDLTLDSGTPGLMLDPRCHGMRRGFNQTYAFRNVQGTNDRGSVVKTFDSHVHDAAQYAALELGSAQLNRSLAAQGKAKRERIAANREAQRYSPLRRSA